MAGHYMVAEHEIWYRKSVIEADIHHGLRAAGVLPDRLENG